MKAPRRKHTVALSLSSGSHVSGYCKTPWRIQPVTPRRKQGAHRSQRLGRTSELSSQEKKSKIHACVCVCLSPGGCEGACRCLPFFSTIPTDLKLGVSTGLPGTREGLKHLLAGAWLSAPLPGCLVNRGSRGSIDASLNPGPLLTLTDKANCYNLCWACSTGEKETILLPTEI